MTAQARVRYPTKAAITRAVDAARELGLDVDGFEVSPDGTIRVLRVRPTEAATASVENEIAQWREHKRSR